MQESDQFQKIGEPTEAALKALIEKLASDDPIFNKQIPVIPDSSALAQLSKKEKLWRVSQVDDKIESQYKRVATFEFSRDRKSMSVLVQKTSVASSSGRATRSAASPSVETGPKFLYVKGAPEQVLERCSKIRFSKSADPAPLSPKLRGQILAKVEEWADVESLRILAFATVENPKVSEKTNPSLYAKVEVILFESDAPTCLE